jgi:hypothetical protein
LPAFYFPFFLPVRGSSEAKPTGTNKRWVTRFSR